ncbi:exosortase C-terminal domain/associated protein EpsI [Geomonas azotofigens]|uniref:exosortase C-terminal domain/associated protein EpsI n=1 Tax=Geomonas azotofigens TaxID=2843196 RepID=UPI001C1240F4|nr:exosortase C-terminal domain/associated protein EpsI [Geomonas azotofigens]MBU5613492.1 EpsI family protein [Geomonas azotofigens]
MRNASFITALILLLLTGVASTLMAYRPVPVVVATNLEKIPMEIDGYRAVEDTFPESVYKELNADKHVYRHYRSPDGSVIDLYIGYYGTAKGGRTGHNPYACLPGAGAAIVDTGIVDLKQLSTNRTVPVNYILAHTDDGNLVMVHWYQTARDKVVSSGWSQNLQRLKGRLLHNRSDGAFIRVSISATDKDLATQKEKAVRFSATVLNIVPSYWPLEETVGH